MFKKLMIYAVPVMMLWSGALMAQGGPGGGGNGGGGGGNGGSTANSTFTSLHFSGSGNCVRCHDGMTDENNQDVSIVKAWGSSIMANSTRDPFWKAKVRTEINRNPHLEGVINDKCTKCHAPMANTEAHHSGDSVGIFDDGFLSASNTHHEEAMDGVSCTLCHQIKNSASLGTLAGFSGAYEIETFAQASDRKIYGPYDNVFANPMINNVDYTIQYSDHVKDSKLCATCHNLKTPFVDENGNLLSTTPESEFPEQMPYSEWEHSEYGQTTSCQQCHMGRTRAPIASRPMSVQNTLRDDFARHEFTGANLLMLDILDTNRNDLDVIGTNFDTMMTQTDSMLQGAAYIDPVNRSLINNTLDLTLRITSNTGHKLPTSFPSRRAILHLAVLDNNGNTVFESGKINSDGSVVGADSDTNHGLYEPHYDLITGEDQVQIYESVMGDNLGDVTYTLLRGMEYKKDNRLLPFGFNKYTASDDIGVIGNAFDDSNFIGGEDEIRYRIDGMTGSRYTVLVELVYQSVSYPFAQDLFTDSSTEITDFQSMFVGSSYKSTSIAIQQIDVVR